MIGNEHTTEVVILDIVAGDIASREFIEGPAPNFKVKQLVIDGGGHYFRIESISDTTHDLTKGNTVVYLHCYYVAPEELPDAVHMRSRLDSAFGNDFGNDSGRAFVYDR